MKYFIVLMALSCLTEVLKAQMTDQISNKYKTTVIGNRIWLAENYRAVTMTNGQKLAFAKDADEWMKYFESKTPCYTYFNFDEKNKNYGLIYNFYAAHSNFIAPKDWKIPSTEDWNNMIFKVGEYNTETAMKLKHNSSWKILKGSINSTGFSAKPHGMLKFCGAFSSPEKYPSVDYWRLDSEDEENGENACSFSISESGKLDLAQGYTGATAGYYIRLCKLMTPDEPEDDVEDSSEE